MTDQQPGSEPPGYGSGGSGWSGYGSSPDAGFGYGAGPDRPEFYAPQPAGYGQYGQYGNGYGGFVPSDPQAKSSATVAFVINLVFCTVCCGFLAVPGAILGALAMSRADLEPESARNLTKWAWICLAIVVGIYVLFIIFIIILGVTGNLDDSSSDY